MQDFPINFIFAPHASVGEHHHHLVPFGGFGPQGPLQGLIDILPTF